VLAARLRSAGRYFPTNEMEIYVKKLLLAVLLIAGVAGCATYPLTAQQKEAIDYQNHKPYTT
jgi:hypothetical protein